MDVALNVQIAMVFANFSQEDKEAFFELLDEYFESRPGLFSGQKPKPKPGVSHQPKQEQVVGLYDYNGTTGEDLTFRCGDRILSRSQPAIALYDTHHTYQIYQMLRLKVKYKNEKYLINFTSDNLNYVKEFLCEFFDIDWSISLYLDGFKVTQGSLKDDDIVDVVALSNKRRRKVSDGDSQLSSQSESESSSTSEETPKEAKKHTSHPEFTHPTPPHSGSTHTHKRNARNKKKLKFFKLENNRAIPYTSLPTNRIPKNIKLTSIDVEDKNFEPGNNTMHVDWRGDRGEQEEQEEQEMDYGHHDQQDEYQDYHADAEQSYMDSTTATTSGYRIDDLQEILNCRSNQPATSAILSLSPSHLLAVEHFKSVASEKMHHGETLTEIPPVGSFVAYKELQLNSKNVPELEMMIAKVHSVEEGVVLLQRVYYTEHMITEIEDEEGLNVEQLVIPIFFETLQQSNGVQL
ncbi:hypothetical protein E3P77_01449 [Wallemia ichthyophaga]|uniref:Uncharacterized protein n=1 Tax=Wallemia ichthyophaga TaxID=245174 RepID=A0A4T0LE49_WALIC|nr:hypothetical protein E3P98_00467 [Wallemia ichthyophaga]TIA90401.1 hypothetical protein E3P97_02576 [Wallemia ichthyophaga]TIA97049.1 hypothetical protein E3P96_03479 [Wallemia ichthyophaga]TIB01203.1 hypothetical protein E3P95_01365 [Wallemia ichthyophaga]TIB02187.1 hypothetical protein E3P94_01497 [Wallemia ichthyophaga]